MNTIKNNIKLGIFNGDFYYDENNILKWVDAKNKVKTDNLEFENDWNYLMQVVEKVESLDKIEDTIYSVTICDKVCRIDTINNEIVWIRGKTKIESVYTVVVSFIKWYNEQKSA